MPNSKLVKIDKNRSHTQLLITNVPYSDSGSNGLENAEAVLLQSYVNQRNITERQYLMMTKNMLCTSTHDSSPVRLK